MGKGSGRRPADIPEEELAKNVDAIFGAKTRSRYVPPPLVGFCDAEGPEGRHCKLAVNHSGPHEATIMGKYPMRWD